MPYRKKPLKLFSTFGGIAMHKCKTPLRWGFWKGLKTFVLFGRIGGGAIREFVGDGFPPLEEY